MRAKWIGPQIEVPKPPPVARQVGPAEAGFRGCMGVIAAVIVVAAWLWLVIAMLRA